MSNLAPLSHRSVLILRTEQQAKAMAEAVRLRGGIPIEIPLLRITPAPIKQVRPLDEYDWMIFTSKNGVRCFLQGIGDMNIPSSVRLAAVGEKTKQALESHGCQVDFIP